MLRATRQQAVSSRRLISTTKETRLRFKIWDDVWTYYRKMNMLTKGLGLAGGIVALVYLTNFTEKKDKLFPALGSSQNIIIRTFENGGGLQEYEAVDSDASVSRAELRSRLRKLLYPDESKQYVVVVGENGTGKSTAVRQAVGDLPFPRGAAYINCPVNAKLFSIKLCQILGFQPEADISGGIRRYIERVTKEEKSTNLAHEPELTFTALQSALMDAAAGYKLKHNRPMVLIIDSADILAKKTPEFFEFLQDFAKDCADRGTLRVVFVSSDGSALPLLMARSAWSRAKKPACEIGEIAPDEEAVSFLMSRGVPRAVAESAVRNVTGGLFAALNDFLSNHMEGKSLHDIMDELDNKTDRTLLQLGVSADNAVFQHILRTGSIKSALVLSLGMSEQEESMLVKNNILASHVNGTLTFHDRQVRVWFEKRTNDMKMCAANSGHACKSVK